MAIRDAVTPLSAGLKGVAAAIALSLIFVVAVLLDAGGFGDRIEAGEAVVGALGLAVLATITGFPVGVAVRFAILRQLIYRQPEGVSPARAKVTGAATGFACAAPLFLLGMWSGWEGVGAALSPAVFMTLVGLIVAWVPTRKS